MKHRGLLITIVVVVAVLVIGYFGWPLAFTVVPIAQVEQEKADAAFDPVKYVDGIWDSKIMPAFDAKAVNLTEILKAMQPNDQGIASKTDLVEVAKKYGLITVGEAHVYLVKGEGKVIAVNDKTSVGVMQIQPVGYDGPIQVMVYLGTRIPSDETSVRDGVGFISFGDFKEQTEYGKVGSEINNRVLAGLKTIDKEQLVGKTVTFTGAMTIRTFNLVNINLKKVTIVPVKIEVKG